MPIIVVNNCENCKYFQKDQRDERAGVCTNPKSQWYNFHRADVFTCSHQEEKEKCQDIS